MTPATHSNGAASRSQFRAQKSRHLDVPDTKTEVAGFELRGCLMGSSSRGGALSCVWLVVQVRAAHRNSVDTILFHDALEHLGQPVWGRWRDDNLIEKVLEDNVDLDSERTCLRDLLDRDAAIRGGVRIPRIVITSSTPS